MTARALPTLISVTQAAKILSLKRQSVLRMVARDALPYVQKLPGVGGVYLFDELAVREIAAVRASRAIAKAEQLDQRASRALANAQSAVAAAGGAA